MADDTDTISNEAFYDAEIAPVLLTLAKVCDARRIPFIATVEFEPAQFGTTGVLNGQTDAMLMNRMAALAKGDIDALAIGWARHVRESGRDHGSIVLKQMGVACKAADR